MDFIIVTRYFEYSGTTTSCETNSEAQTFLDSLKFSYRTPLLHIFHCLAEKGFKLICQSSTKDFTTYTFCGRAPIVMNFDPDHCKSQSARKSQSLRKVSNSWLTD